MRHFSRSFIAFIAIAGLLLSVVLPARADTTITLTTTSDFDSGSKSDPGNPFFASQGVAQPMNWASYPSAWYYNGNTYVTWQGSASYLPFVAAYNHAAMRWTGPVAARSSNPVVGDSHGAPAILVDASGYIHVFCCSHSSAMKHVRSTNPEDISTWTSLTDPELTEGTYPHMILYGSTPYMFYRSRDATPHQWSWRSSSDGGTSWSAKTLFIDMGSVPGRVYVGAMELYGSKVYFSFSYEKPSAGGRVSMYVAYYDIAAASCFSISGTNLGSSIDMVEANASLRIEAGDPWQINAMGLHLDSSGGGPNLLYRSGTGTGTGANWGFNFTRWTGSSWTAPVKIRSADGPAVLSGGGSGQGDFVMNSASNLEAFLIAPGPRGTGGDLERWTSTNTGATWAKAETILAQRTAGVALEAPMSVKGFVSGMKVVFDTQHISGASDYGIHPEERMYAWGDSGLVYDTRYSYGYGVETVTDDAIVTGGQVQLSSGLGDTFVHTNTPYMNTTKWSGLQWIASGQEGISRCNTLAISSGVFNVAVTTDQFIACVAVSTFTVSGNFDIQVKASTPIDGSGRQANLCILDVASTCQGTDATLFQSNGFWYQNGGDGILTAVNQSAGVDTVIGSTTNVGAPVDPLCLRITRSGTTFKFYYSTSPTCASWTLDETFVRGDAPNSFNIMLICVNNGATDGTCIFDDYVLAAGTVNAPGYRANGYWTSPVLLTTDAPLIANKIVVGVANLSAMNTVSVELFDDRGTDRTYGPYTSGSAITVLPGVVFQGNVSIRIFIIGNGASTPSVLDVTLIVGDFNPAQASLMPIIMLFAIWAFLLSLGMGTKSGIFVLFSGLAAVGIGLYMNSAYTGLPATFITVLMGGIGLISIFVGLLAMEMVRE